MKKATGAVVGLFAAGPLLLAIPILAIGAGSASASCSNGSAQAVDGAAVAAQVKEILDGGNGKGTVSVPGLNDLSEQVPNAKSIQATGIAMNIPARGQIVALATALQESGLRNLTYGDRDSLGLFQQRPSQGWGTANEILDPVHASTRFYEALEKVSGWQSLSIAQAAQAVQRSGYPGAYAKWEPLATALQQALDPLLKKTADASPPASGSTAPSSAVGCTSRPCGVHGSLLQAVLRGHQEPPRRLSEGPRRRHDRGAGQPHTGLRSQHLRRTPRGSAEGPPPDPRVERGPAADGAH